MISKRQTISALALAFAMMPMAQAATFLVTTTIDETDASPGDGVCQTLNGDCTLRAAVQEANAWAGADVITLPEGLYVLALKNPDLSSSADESLAAWGDLNIRDALTINGAGADVVAIDAMAKHRVIEVLPNSDLMEVSLSGLTIRNGNGGSSNGNGGGITTASNTKSVLRLSDCNIDGNTAAAGGGIHIEWGHYLVMDRCVVSNNSSLSHGAGINNAQGTVAINHSVISGNTHVGFGNPFGGGIYNSSSSPFGTNLGIAGIERAGLTITNTTISGNSAFIDGGGLYHVIGPLHIENTTISGNTAEKWGGGIFMAAGNYGPVANRFQHVTITDNVSIGIVSRVTENPPPLDPRGGGVYVRGKIDLYNSIVAYNGSGMNCYLDLSNYSNPGSTNKIANIISDNSCLNFGEAASPMPSVALMSLTDNGGPTQTHALFSYSDAVDIAAPYTCLSSDQRGYLRDANCDAGSYEYNAVAPLNELLPTPAYAGLPAVRDNIAPIAFGMPLAVNFGGSVSGVVSAADSDGDPLTYEFTQLPVYGSVGWDGLPPGRFTYSSDPDLDGALKADSFSFRACDGIACSATATVTLFIGDSAVAGDIAISLTTDGVLSDLTVISESSIEALVADVDYTAPLGAFFFGVSDIPVDTGQNSVTVVIQLPVDAVIDPSAVVRKLDNNDVWQTLATSGTGVSTATINAVDKTMTLVLLDNDIFDRDPTVGIIYDPVALSVPVKPPLIAEALRINVLVADALQAEVLAMEALATENLMAEALKAEALIKDPLAMEPIEERVAQAKILVKEALRVERSELRVLMNAAFDVEALKAKNMLIAASEAEVLKGRSAESDVFIQELSDAVTLIKDSLKAERLKAKGSIETILRTEALNMRALITEALNTEL